MASLLPGPSLWGVVHPFLARALGDHKAPFCPRRQGGCTHQVRQAAFPRMGRCSVALPWPCHSLTQASARCRLFANSLPEQAEQDTPSLQPRSLRCHRQAPCCEASRCLYLVHGVGLSGPRPAAAALAGPGTLAADWRRELPARSPCFSPKSLNLFTFGGAVKPPLLRAEGGLAENSWRVPWSRCVGQEPVMLLEGVCL